LSGSSSGGSVFNMGSQQAGAIYQSAGDQIISHAGGRLDANVIGAVSDLKLALARAAPQLSSGELREADHLMSTVEDQLRRPEPDKQQVAGALQRILRILKGAGAFAESVDAFHQLAVWLGVAGAGLLQLLWSRRRQRSRFASTRC